MIRFRCHSCNQKFSVPEKFIGNSLVCKVCGTMVPVPEKSTIAERTSAPDGSAVPPSMPQNVTFVTGTAPVPPQSHATPVEKLQETIPAAPFTPPAPPVPAASIAPEPPAAPSVSPVSSINKTATGALTVKPVSPAASGVPSIKKPSLSVTSGGAPSLKKTASAISPASTVAPSIKKPTPVATGCAPSIKRPIPGSSGAPAIKPHHQSSPPPQPAATPSQAPATAAPHPALSSFISGKASVAAPAPQSQPAASGGISQCAAHPGEAAVGKCSYCGKSICWKCQSEFNGTCGDICQKAAAAKNYEKQMKSEMNQHAMAEIFTKIVKWGFKLALLAGVVALIWWIYIEFLDPGGKLAWKWEKSLSVSNLCYLKYDDKVFNFIAGDKLRTLDTQTGKLITEKVDKRYEECLRLIKKTDDRYIFQSEQCIQVLDGKGDIVWRKEFKDPLSIVQCSDNAIILQTTLYIKAQKYRDPPTIVRNMYALNAKDGKEYWSRKLEKDEYYSSITVGKEYYAYISGGGYYLAAKKEKPEVSLRVHTIKDNKAKWKIKLNDAYAINPTILNGKIFFKMNDKLRVLSISEAKELWSLPVKGFGTGWGSEFELHDGLLFFTSQDTLTTVDFEQGKILWAEKAPADSSLSFTYAGGRLYFRGTKKIPIETGEATKRKLPKAYEEVAKDSPMIQQMLNRDPPKFKYETIITSIDARTGKKLWVTGKIFGQLIAEGQQVVMVRDTAQTTMFSAINSRHGDTVVEQFNYETGKRLFQRSDPIAVTGPYVIIGDKLVCMIFERGATMSRSNMMSGKVNYLGVAAFNLKK